MGGKRRPDIVGREVNKADLVFRINLTNAAREENEGPVEQWDQVRMNLFDTGRDAVEDWVG